MADKKPAGPSKADQVTALRFKRYMERGPGAKVKIESDTHKRIAQIEQLASAIAAVPPTKSKAAKKAAKKRRAKRGR